MNSPSRWLMSSISWREQTMVRQQHVCLEILWEGALMSFTCVMSFTRPVITYLSHGSLFMLSLSPDHILSLWLLFLSLSALSLPSSGWMMGERLHDGERGWFLCRVVEEIQSKELRAQNLRECQRIHQAQGGGSSLAPKMASRGRRSPKVSNFFDTWTDQSEEGQ